MPEEIAPAFSDTNQLPKAPTGIKGFDEITFGGLPLGRPTLITGGAGSGKTLFGMEFLVRGATEFNEPGVFVSFEESEADLISNFASLGFDLKRLVDEKRIILDQVHIERSEIEETGEYDLEGLFIRIGHAIDSVRARRVVLDTIEALFSGFPSQFILRAELRRLFRWLKNKGVTAVITAEQGNTEGAITRHGLEEYVSDCVIVLDHRVREQITTRRLQVAKYRGSSHGTNEYPFLIDEGGLSVLPITSVGLDYEVSSGRISTGIPRLDMMLGGEGFYRGTSILVSGTAGTGKTSIAAYFANQVCSTGERCLYYAFEESSSQIIRNMHSIGLDLERRVEKGLLRFEALRPTFYGLEMHLSMMHRAIEEFTPSVVVVDPISNLVAVGTPGEVKIALMRLVDLLKGSGITSLFTNLTQGGSAAFEETGTGVSSLIDTWIDLKDIVSGGERNRGLSIIKSRGMGHSNQIREFLFSEDGIELLDVYVGPAGVITGSARAAQEARDRTEEFRLDQEIERKKREIERKRRGVEAQVALLRSQLEADEEELKTTVNEQELKKRTLLKDREEMARLRSADKKPNRKQGGRHGKH